MSSLEEEGRRIAEQLGKDVDYKGPWLPYGPQGEFLGHFFQDKVTGSSFANKTLEEAKASLIKMRKDFGAKPPVFKNDPEGGAFLALPVLGIGAAALLGILSLQHYRPLTQRVYYQDGQYLVSVRYPGQWYNLQDFVQPSNPDVLAVCSQFGPDPWGLYDFVCRNIDYKRDVGEFWQTPSETLRGYGDCEDSANLLTSLIRAGGAPNCYVALGNLGGYGHAWCEFNGQILETTFTSARVVPNPTQYCPYIYFNDQKVEELWPGALGEVFGLGRDEEAKLSLMAEAL